MSEDLIPSEGANDKSNKHTSTESKHDAKEKIHSSDTNKIIESNSIWVILGLIDAGISLFFWGFSEFFGGHNAPILANVCFFLFVALILAGIAGYTFKYFPNKAVVCFLYVVVSAISGTVIYSYSKPIHLEEIKWQPPELPELCEQVSCTWGFLRTVQTDKAKGGFDLSIPINHETNTLRARVKNNRLYIEGDIRVVGKQRNDNESNLIEWVVDFDRQKAKDIPLNWDRNYSSNAFEIIDAMGVPIFQMRYDRPEHLVINGVFFMAKDAFMVAHEHSCLIGNFTVNGKPNPITLPAGMNKMFKYPSWKYLGQYNENDVSLTDIKEILSAGVTELKSNTSNMAASVKTSQERTEFIARQVAQAGASVVKIEEETKPRSISLQQREYARTLLAQYKGTPFIIESFADPDSTRFGETMADLLNDNGWALVGSSSGGQIKMGGGVLPRTVEPIGVVIEVNQSELIGAASALDTFLSGCKLKSHVYFIPNPAIVIGGQGVHVRVGTEK